MFMEILFENQKRNTISRVNSQNVVFLENNPYYTHKHITFYVLPVIFYTACAPVRYNLTLDYFIENVPKK